MSLPFAAVAALVAALLETSVFSELRIAGAKPDLVFVLAVVSAMMVGVEEGLVWASLGGSMLDMLLLRPVGATMLALLIVVGIGIVVARVIGTNRTAVAIVATAVLTWAYQFVSTAVLALTAGSALRFEPVAIIPIAVINTFVALVAALAVRWALTRFGAPERVDW